MVMFLWIWATWQHKGELKTPTCHVWPCLRLNNVCPWRIWSPSSCTGQSGNGALFSSAQCWNIKAKPVKHLCAFGQENTSPTMPLTITSYSTVRLKNMQYWFSTLRYKDLYRCQYMKYNGATYEKTTVWTLHKQCKRIGGILSQDGHCHIAIDINVNSEHEQYRSITHADYLQRVKVRTHLLPENMGPKMTCKQNMVC